MIRASFPAETILGKHDDQGSHHKAGFFTVPRSFWDDPDFADGKMSEREAYLWLLREASWKPRRVRFEKWVFDLQRGQLAVSCRFLAKRFRWSEPSVRRYLKRLENRRRIQRCTDAGITVITLLDYEETQLSPRNHDAVLPSLASQDRRTCDANKNTVEKENNRKKEALGQPCKKVDMATSPATQTIPDNASTGDAMPIPLPAAIRTAVGLPPDHRGGYWTDAHLQNHIRKWRALGLSDARIIVEAKASRAENPIAPDEPKALDRWMETAARNKHDAAVGTDRVKPQGSTEASSRERLEFFARKLNSGAFVAPSAISVQTAQKMLAAKLVTPSLLRNAGIVF